MAKLLLRAGFCLHAGLGLAVAALPFCMPLQASSQPPRRLPGIFPILGFGKKKAATPEPPPLKATQPPALTIPVEPLGFSSPGQFYLGMRDSLVSLDFLDENRLLFTFRVPGLLHRDSATSDSSNARQIRALVLRLPEGAVQTEAVWTLHDRTRYIYMLDKGQFLLRDRNDLQLGDSSLQLKPFLHFPGPVLWVEQDPARQYLVTGSAEPRGKTPKPDEVPRPATAQATVLGEEKVAPEEPDIVLRILRRDSGKVMLVSRVRSAVHLPINTDGYLEALRSKGTAWILNLNYFTGGSKVLGSVDSVCNPIIHFISPAEFLVRACNSNGDPKLVAMGTNGRRLWENSGIGPSVWPQVVAAPDGSRTAWETLVTDHGVNAFSPLGSEDIKAQAVQVFDAATGKVVLRAQASPIFDAGGNVAISPSGRRVAVLMAGAIQVFDLPPAPALPVVPVDKGAQ